eukprot:7253047-Alexandrium_andersonii.AAC.1
MALLHGLCKSAGARPMAELEVAALGRAGPRAFHFDMDGAGSNKAVFVSRTQRLPQTGLGSTTHCSSHRIQLIEVSVQE